MKLPLGERNVTVQVSTKLDKIPDYFRDTMDWLIGRSRKKNPDKENLVTAATTTNAVGGTAIKKNKLCNNDSTASSASYRRNLSVDLASSSVCDTLESFGFERLAALPNGLDVHEWIAAHLLEFFHHVNALYGAISELCTVESCPVMNGHGNTYLMWVDEKGKKCKYSAPQYVDCVMSFIEKVLDSEDAFPTKFGHNFPVNFDLTAKKLTRLLYNVLNHIHSVHWKHLCSLGIQIQSKAMCYHFLTFSKHYNILDVKEINILNDLLKNLRSEHQLIQTSAAVATSSFFLPSSLENASATMDLINDVLSDDSSTSSRHQENMKLVDLHVANCSDITT